MKPSNNSTSVCPKAHRTTERTRSGLCKIKWRAWRGQGAPCIGYYSGATWEEAEAKERADAARRAIRYGEAHAGHAPIDKLGALLDYFEASGEFKKCRASMQRQRRYCIASMRTDPLVTDRARGKKCRLEDFPLAALGAKATRGIFKAWRDAQYEQRGPRASSFRVQTLKRALNVAKDSNFIATNPLDGFETPTGTERADLIWEDHHQAAYFSWIEAERLRIEREAETDKGMRQNAPKMLARLGAGELALRAALWIRPSQRGHFPVRPPLGSGRRSCVPPR